VKTWQLAICVWATVNASIAMEAVKIVQMANLVVIVRVKRNVLNAAAQEMFRMTSSVSVVSHLRSFLRCTSRQRLALDVSSLGANHF
jgi:hypothetical protein